MSNIRFQYFLGIAVISVVLISPLSVSSSTTRPQWLLTQTDLSTKSWPIDVDYLNGNSWYLGFNAPNGGFISVQPEQFSSTSSASAKVLSDNATIKQVIATGELEYAFPNFRFNLSDITTGYAWEIKSPCCYTRGETFSLDSSYVHIFGSQASKWQDLNYIFDKQVAKLENYYNMPVSQDLLKEIHQYEQTYNSNPLFSLDTSTIAGIFFLIILPAIGIALVAYKPIMKKFRKTGKKS